MPSTYVLGMGRITLPVSIDGHTHKVRHYCRNVQAVGSTFNVNSRATDANDQDWQAVADSLAALLANFYATATTFGNMSLERWSGAVWELKQFHTPTTTAGTVGTYIPGSQQT